jgi:hypothetical protein
LNHVRTTTRPSNNGTTTQPKPSDKGTTTQPSNNGTTTKPTNNSTTTIPSNNITETYAEANELVNYGNGTLVWYNRTNVMPGQSSYDLTASVAIVDSSYFSGLDSHEVLAINHVWQNSTNYWTLWIYCEDADAWAASDWGADYLKIGKTGLEVKLLTGNISLGSDTFAWYYQRPPSIDPSTWAPPQPGANKVSQCW